MLKTKDVAVLDIGSAKVSVLIGHKTAQNIFSIRAAGEALYDGYQQGEWYSTDSLFAAVETALRKAESELDFRVKKLYIGVPAEFSAVQCKNVSVNFGRSFRVTDQEIDLLLKKGDTYRNDPDFTVINSSAINYMCDESGKRIMEPRGLSAYKLSGLISYVLAERRFIRLMEDFARELRIKEIEFISQDWAQVMSLFEPEQRDNYVLLANIGYISSSISLSRGDGILSMISFSLGGAHISADISQVEDMPFRSAETIKEKIDLNLSFAEGDCYESYDKRKADAITVNQIAKDRIESFAEIIGDAVTASEVKCPDYAPLYLTGEGISSMRGAKEFLSTALKRTVDTVSPTAPGYNRPDCSSALSLLDMASRLSGYGGKSILKTLFGLK